MISTIAITKEPEVTHTRERKLLRQEQRNPAKGIEVRLDAERKVDVTVKLVVLLRHDAVELVHPTDDARDAVGVGVLVEDVANLAHQAHETPKRVRLGVLAPFGARVVGQNIIDRPNDLVHALHIALAGIELGEDEQYPSDNLPMILQTLATATLATVIVGVVLGVVVVVVECLVLAYLGDTKTILDNIDTMRHILHPTCYVGIGGVKLFGNLLLEKGHVWIKTANIFVTVRKERQVKNIEQSSTKVLHLLENFIFTKIVLPIAIRVSV